MIFSLLQRSSVNIRIVTQYTTVGALSKDLTVLYVEDLSPREAKDLQNHFTFPPTLYRHMK